MPADFDCDVVVIGGGPAGSTAASALARAGRSVVLLERDRFPRFHIGESLLASVNDVFDAIGVADRIRAAGFPKKWGATFMTPDGRVERFADFAISDEVRAPQTWQVPRERMDTLLLEHAAASGADVRQGHRVLDVAFDDDGATVSVRPPAMDGAPTATAAIRARVVVDASGRAGLLSRAFSLRVDEPTLANVAIFSHYAGVPRKDGRRAGDIRVVARRDLGWFWLIPISDDLMSVGVVLPQSVFLTLPKLEPDVLLERLIGDTPAVARLMADAERKWPVRVEKDFSFGSRAYAGDRWIIVGDAGSFLDPVFSSGVAIALESALEGARAVDRALARRPPERQGVRPLRSAAAPALRVVPALRARLLHAGLPRPVLQRRSAEAHVPGRGHGARRLLAPVARDPRVAGAVLPQRAAAAALRVRRLPSHRVIGDAGRARLDAEACLHTICL